MGRYIHGTGGFSYKYRVAKQSSNLSELGNWSGLEQTNPYGGALFAHFLAPVTQGNQNRFELVDAVSWTIGVFRTSIPSSVFGMELSDNVEDAIDQICQDWYGVVRAVEAYLPGPAETPDLSIVSKFNLRRKDWQAFATRIGQDIDLSDRESILRAREIVFESGEGDYLPLLACNALLHAVDKDLDSLELVDGERGETNLWYVAESYASTDRSKRDEWDSKDALSRLYAWQSKWHDAEVLMRELLDKRPDAIKTASALFARFLAYEKFEDLFALSNTLLEKSTSEDARTEYLFYRAEALWELDKKDEAREDAKTLVELGRPFQHKIFNE